MLYMICRYLNLCCDLDPSCLLLVFTTTNSSIVHDLVECLLISASNKRRLQPFLASLFQLLAKLVTSATSSIDTLLVALANSWHNITAYILDEVLLADAVQSTDLYEQSLQFYSCFLSKLSLLSDKSSEAAALLADVTCVLDTKQELRSASLGTELCKRLIKEFDKNFLVDTNPTTKLIISNTMKAVVSVSADAKKAAVDAGLVETLIEHLKYTHSKLNLKSLSIRGSLREHPCVGELQQTLMILKHLMCGSEMIKEVVTKSGLVVCVHSLWCWAVQDQGLLKAVLSTLCTLTAANKLAVSAVSMANVGAFTTMNGKLDLIL
jgi:hypothetical protein